MRTATRKLLVLTAFAAVIMALPELAQACAVCSGGDDLAVKDSYIDATIFMSILPLAVIGGGVYTLRRRFQARDAEFQGPVSKGP